MKPNDLYTMPPKKTETCLGSLKGFGYDHLPEIEEDHLFGLENKNEKVMIKVYVDYSFDGRRSWKLASVWFDEQPVMVVQNAGREGDDHSARFITSKELFSKMVEYIESLSEEEETCVGDLYNEDEDVEGLDAFYDHRLSDFYDPDFVPAYIKGDVVEAVVAVQKEYGYIFDHTPMVKKKVRILDVDKGNPYDTYRYEEVERFIKGEFDFKTKLDTRKIIEVEREMDITGERIYGRMNKDCIQIS
ncbi:hypothetical protein IMZ31_22105 (plasmid) [Pontibacillus sp. ALD_SL1]|uniref:hypothetical protein n=1 Tax=Pontibacillus sp. ALD_SL1 TaxID=2777185 RepID=UPI001A97ADAA|nr:hypothetical protein [Pontibacillus sp. ALD_SL1]QST02148.1 hypothetical protein IMZ31_22105 [Pontibacillus sp. ALD_SL1]